MRWLCWTLMGLAACDVVVVDPDTTPDTTVSPPGMDLDGEPACDALPAMTAACPSAPLKCGDVFEATTAGGNQDFDLQRYTDLFCIGASPDGPNAYDGPEASFALELAPGEVANVWVDGRCDGARAWSINSNAECPDSPPNCSSPRFEDGISALEGLRGGDNGDRFLILVDGPVETTFTIGVDCAGD